MEAELARLDNKVTMLAQLATDLRAENTVLRQKMLQLQQDNAKLKQKLEGAGVRISAILAKMPEDAE